MPTMTQSDEYVSETASEALSDLEQLFPLPLAPIENYLVFDDRPDCPMTSFIELHFASPLQERVLAEALCQTVHKHPLLASTLVEIDGHLHWQYNPRFVPELRNPATEPILAPSDLLDNDQPNPRPIDLHAEPGCRFWYQDELSDERSVLTLQLHHAACDGVGLRRVLIDALGAYAEMTGNPAQVEETEREIRKRKREQIEPNRLLDRADFSELKSKPAKQKQSIWRKIANAHFFHFQRPQPLLGAAGNKLKASTSAHPLAHYAFDMAMSERLQDTCKEHEIGVNDLMLTILFRVCQQWNQQRGFTHDGTRIRVLMPVDLRGRSDLQMPATNRLSFAFLGRTHRRCDEWKVLLEGVQKETQMIKDTRVHMDFLDALAGLAPHPQWFKRAIRYSRNMTTTVLTYTGDISRGMKSYFPEKDGRRQVGDSYLEHIFVAPPAHENTNITLGVCINWGQVCVSANWNRAEITADECNQFLQLFADATEECLTAIES